MCLITCPEFCTIDELSESWGVKIDLIKENYFEYIELRGIDAGYKIL